MANKVNSRIRLVMSILLLLTLSAAIMGKTIYVDDDTAGANDGSSWENAYTFLQDALSDAEVAEKPIEIRVAHGTYKPDQGRNQMLGDQAASFHVINGVSLIGGYSGLVGVDPNKRDIEQYKSTLSGDLAANDVNIVSFNDIFDEPTFSDNSSYVVRSNYADQTAILDGFTITGGRRKSIGIERTDGGAGMINYSGNPIIRNCTFTRNIASQCGGGMLNMNESNPTIEDCTFISNYSSIGGGIYNSNSNPILIRSKFMMNYSEYGGGGIGINNYALLESQQEHCLKLICCIFDNNYALQNGGGLSNYESDTILTDCTFLDNSAHQGGGMYNHSGNPNLINCQFISNSASQGGGMYNGSDSPKLNNCQFIRNNAQVTGGGLAGSDDANSLLTECVFIDNSSNICGGGIAGSNSIHNCLMSGNTAVNDGGAIYGWGEVINCTVIGNKASGNGGGICTQGITTLVNGIYHNNDALFGDEIYLGVRIPPVGRSGTILRIPSVTTVSYNNVRGGKEKVLLDNDCTLVWGPGNIDVDPCFADPGYWADADDANIVVEPNDPNAVWIDGDYHLKSQAGRWDPASESWVQDDVTSPCIDTGDPNSPIGHEPFPNGGIINMGAYGGTAEASLSLAGAEEIVYIQWLGHSTVNAWTDNCIVYVDPQNLSISPHDATLICVTHTHGDHYSPSDIAKVSNAETQFIAPPDVVQRYGRGQTIAPGQIIELDFVSVKAVPSYNTNKPNHPKSNNWVGFIIELGGKRIYVAGDTDLIDEMKSLGDIDVAFLPAGGTYTMNATEAAEVTEYIKPDLAIPYHWGQSVGTLADAQRFAELARCPAKVLAVDEMISSDNWPEYSPLITHWALDEVEGDIAHDSAGENHGTLYGDPGWQPAGGKIDGALQIDGIDDYISTDFVLDPAKGSFSVFSWIKGGAAGQVVISQTNGTGTGETWLGADPLLGKLMTGLVPPPTGRFVPQPLVSDSIVTDGQWHHIGFAWDGSYRALYVDGIEVKKDAAAQNPLKSADGGIYIGAGKTLDAVTFFSGLIDDVRIYNVALTAEEIEELAH